MTLERQGANTAAPSRVGLILVFLFLFAATGFVSVALPGAAAHAQDQQAGKVYRIGLLRAGQLLENYVVGFQQGLREREYVDGRNVVVEFRATDGSFDQLPRFAEELVRSKVDVILASAAPAALAARGSMSQREASCHMARTSKTCSGMQLRTWTRS